MLQLIREKFLLRIVAAICLLVALHVYNDRITTNYRHSDDVQMRMAVLKTLGGPAIPIIAQCCTSRNLSEGIYSRRSDIPGGFCFHSDCDVVAVPKSVCEKNYTIKEIKKKCNWFKGSRVHGSKVCGPTMNPAGSGKSNNLSKCIGADWTDSCFCPSVNRTSFIQ